jgi:hypothetical protein
MARRRGPPSQGWRTFLRNHADAIAAIDLFVVPTVTFECLFAFLVMSHGRRQPCGDPISDRRVAKAHHGSTSYWPNCLDFQIRGTTIKSTRSRRPLRMSIGSAKTVLQSAGI